MDVRSVLFAATVAFLALGAKPASTSADAESVTLPPASVQMGTTQDQGSGVNTFERDDCAFEDAACQSTCAQDDRKTCLSSVCAPRLALCLSSLPVSRSVSLPAGCLSADREAITQLERQGEIMDVEPVLLAEAYHTLIRARIACRAGRVPKALDLLDQIQESLRRKPVRQP